MTNSQVDKIEKTELVRLSNGLEAECYFGKDEAGNERLFTTNGVTLEVWRNGHADKLVPPWILDRDFNDPMEYTELVKRLR